MRIPPDVSPMIMNAPLTVRGRRFVLGCDEDDAANTNGVSLASPLLAVAAVVADADDDLGNAAAAAAVASTSLIVVARNGASACDAEQETSPVISSVWNGSGAMILGAFASLVHDR